MIPYNATDEDKTEVWRLIFSMYLFDKLRVTGSFYSSDAKRAKEWADKAVREMERMEK